MTVHLPIPFDDDMREAARKLADALNAYESEAFLLADEHGTDWRAWEQHPIGSAIIAAANALSGIAEGVPLVSHHCERIAEDDRPRHTDETWEQWQQRIGGTR